MHELKGYSLSMPRYVKHTTQVYLQDDGYKAVLIFEVGGNCKGGSIIESALNNVEDWDFKKENVKKGLAKTDEDGYVNSLTLIHDNGDTLEINLHDGFERELSMMVTGAEIVKWEEEKR